MQSGFTGHVTPNEWRWVLIVSIMLVALAFAPFLWIVLNNDPDSGWHFMGALHGHLEASAYLSRVRQGIEGNILVQFLHTPERHPGIIVQPIYSLLGQMSRLAADSLSPILVFHVARVSVTVFMYLALYQLAAVIWVRVRTRRVFFVLVSVGSGFGWISVALTVGRSIGSMPIDITHSQISPFFSGLVSIHIPLTIACLALVTAIIVAALRPGVQTVPSVKNSGIVAFVLGIILVLSYPESYMVLALSLSITIGIQWFFARKITYREILWMLWILVPALPILIYYVLILRSNHFVTEWIQQRAGQPIDPFQLIIGFGGVLLIGLPSIIRAIRLFESDSDRYMIIWLLVASIGALLPMDIRTHCLVGAMIPVAYFATRAIEDVWRKRFPPPYRKMVFSITIPILMISNLLILFVPIIPLSSAHPTAWSGLVVSTEYRAAFDWLDEQTSASDVVMASPEIGGWLPLWLGARSVAGHPYETMNVVEKISMVSQWYRIDAIEECENMLTGLKDFEQVYNVNFVIYGPRESLLGDAKCLNRLNFVASFGNVAIYQVPVLFPQ